MESVSWPRKRVVGYFRMSDPILDEMIARLVSAFHPEEIFLFGSRARGTASQDSDYDLLVVVESSDQPRYRRDQAAFRALCGVGASKDVLVFTRAEFERGKAALASLPATVMREGKRVHAA